MSLAKQQFAAAPTPEFVTAFRARRYREIENEYAAVVARLKRVGEALESVKALAQSVKQP